MKRRTLVCFVLLGLLVVLGPAAQVVPVAISPGRAGGVAVVGELCPTFSWTSVDWAVGYRVAVFEALGVVPVSYEQMASGGSTPVLTKEIEGRGLSWTPSTEEGLPGGGMYVWYVEATGPSGPGVWSLGRVFIVSGEVGGVATEERVTKVLRENGIREEVITDVMKEIKSGEARTTAGDVGSRPLGDVRSQGTEGDYNTFYGLDAGKNTLGNYNSFFGRSAGKTNVTGVFNTFIGYASGFSNTGNYNTFIGDESGRDHTSGSYNTFLGMDAGEGQTIGNYNTFIGYGAGLYNASGGGNVFVGYKAGANETGSNKLYIDNFETSNPLIYGEFDNDIVTINGKFAIGTKTPSYPMELKTTGRNATFIMQRSDGGALNFVNATSAYGQFGTGNNYPVRILVNQAWKMQLNADNSLVLANGAGCTAGGHWYDSGYSSRELKENIEELGVAESQAALEQLVPVKYSYKVEQGERHVGFIAEDVPELVATKDRKAVGAMDVVGVLTKVMQEQQKTLFEYQKSLTEQQRVIADQDKALSEQRKAISELRERMAKIESKGNQEKQD